MVKCSTGLSAKQFADLVIWVEEELEDQYIPPRFGLGKAVRACLIYLRHNLSQACIGQLLGVSQSTISRAVCALTGLIGRALDGWLAVGRRDRPAPVLRAGRHAFALLGLEGPAPVSTVASIGAPGSTCRS